MNVKALVQNFIPGCEQETEDRRMMLKYIAENPDVLLRTNETAHFTASAWVTNPAHDKILMLYHNIYNSWAWPGGHADGECDLASVALREVQEETGLQSLRLAGPQPFSLEILTVNAHFKKGKYIVPHLHLNLTYLIEADDSQSLCIKPDENSGLRWFSPDEAVSASTEPDMQIIYRKLNQRLKDYNI